MIENVFRWVEIYVQDMERAKQFYEEVFQVTLERLQTPSVVQEVDEAAELFAFPMSSMGPGAGGALVKIKGVPSSGSGTIAYFGSRDCLVEQGRIVAAGGSIHRPKSAIAPYGFIVLANDTEGNLFGIHSME